MSLPSSTTTPAKPAALSTGDVVADRYKIDRLLGEGGMGAVYRAEHIHMRKVVALKVLHAEVSNHEEIVARFEREAVVAGNIEHPNVVAATDFGRLPGGSFFLVLEYVDGRSLRDELAPKKPLGPARSLAILRGIVAGVGAAHQKGIVHRDLKPENVMLTDRGADHDFPKVLDFGIAKLETPVVDSQKPSGVQALTRIGMIYGTPDYMAPEQALGEPVDARADLYAVGVIAFEMLNGSAPWAGGAMTQIRERLLAEAAPDLPPEIASAIDPRLREIVKKLLARETKDRFQTAEEVQRALDAVGDGESPKSAIVVAPSQVPTPPVPETATAKTQHAMAVEGASASPRRFVIMGAAAFAVVIVVVAILALTAKNPTTGATAEASASASAEPPPSESVTPPPLASLEPPEPAPSASASAAHPLARPGRGRARPPAGRKEGPGGIYIPPPDQWFKK